MRDVDHALDILRQRTGLADLAFDPDGVAEIVIDDILPIHFIRVSPEILELSTPLDDVFPDPGADTQRRLLIANCLGAGAGAGRFAIDPATGGVVLCERVDVAGMDADRFDARLLEFARTAAFWAAGSAETPAPEPAASITVPTLDALRV